jgi:hypothetical protein
MTTFGDQVFQFGGVPVGGDLFGRMGDGKVFYVDPSSGSAGNTGEKPTEAFNTLQAGIDACTAGRGDIVVRMRGGEEVTSTVSFNKAGITVVASSHGVNRYAQGELFSTYAASTFTDGPVATITASRCRIIGLGFVSRDTGATFYDGAAMLIGGAGAATPFGVSIENCRFPKWNLDNRIGIAIEGGSDILVEGCSFEGVGSDFDSGIYVQGASQNIDIKHNHFRDCTYAVVFGAFAGGGPEAIIAHNHCEGSKLLSASSTATALVADNWLMTATDTGSFSGTVNALNAYGIQMSDNHYAE